jgi:hypothetical protein
MPSLRPFKTIKSPDSGDMPLGDPELLAALRARNRQRLTEYWLRRPWQFRILLKRLPGCRPYRSER